MCSDITFGTVEEVWSWGSGFASDKKVTSVKVDESRKKCKKCNFFSYCHIKKEDCKACNKHCFYCGKLGHFPKSMNCKKYRKVHQHKKKQNGIKQDGKKYLSKTNLRKIKKRIMEIEDVNEVPNTSQHETEKL